jgi:hypothetical protein
MACLHVIYKCNEWPPNAEARPYRALNNPFNILPLTQVNFHIKPFLHPRAWPPFLKSQHMITGLRAGHEAVTAEVVVVLFFHVRFRLIG